MLVDHAHQAIPQGKAAVREPQRLSDQEQLEILALLEAVSTDRSAMRAARALAELMGHLHGLGQRIAGELSDQDRDIKPARR
jgi:DNA repair protein RadC